VTALLGFVVIIALATAVYAVANRRSPSERPSAAALPSPPIVWTKEISLGAGTSGERIALVERLKLVGDERSMEILERALSDETDDDVRAVIWRALLELRTHE
jgi:hypothetical protein